MAEIERDKGTYRVTDVRASIRYPGPGGTERVVESGQTASDLPAASVKWLLERGWVERAAPEKAKPAEKPAEKPEAVPE